MGPTYAGQDSTEHPDLPLSAHSAQRDGPAAVPAEVPTSRWELAGRYLLVASCAHQGQSARDGLADVPSPVVLGTYRW